VKKSVCSTDGRHEPLEAEKKFPSRAQAATVPVVKKNKGGRPKGSGIKLTPETQRTILGAVRAGNFRTVACNLAGIDPDTLAGWIKKGEKGVEPYASFVKEFRQAELECEVVLVATWKKAAPQDWRAAKELLAKRYPERWSDHAARLAVLGPDGYGEVGFQGSGLQIILHLNGEDCPNCRATPGELMPERDRTAEIEDHRARERDIEIIEVLSSTPIKDTL
jgi:hypothetical protein